MPRARNPRRQPAVEFALDDCTAQIAAIRAGKIEFHALAKGNYPGDSIAPHILPGLNSVGYWDCRSPQDWGLAPHHNEGIEFVFLESGNMSFVVDGQLHALQPGHLTLTRPWQLHKLGDPHIGRGRLYWLILDLQALTPKADWQWPGWIILEPADRAAFEQALKTNATSVWSAPAVRAVFREIATCVRDWHQPHAVSRLAIAINRLLVEVLEIALRNGGDDRTERVDHRELVGRFLQQLADDLPFCARQWTVESMAEHCEMGVTTLTKYCAEWVNTSPTVYLNQCRVQHAAHLLTGEPGLGMTEVALRCGYNSGQYFATVFRRIHQMTPSEYRERNSPRHLGADAAVGEDF